MTRKILAAAVVIAVACLVVNAENVHAQYEEGDNLVVANVMYGFCTAENTDEGLSGWGAGMTFDKVSFGGNISVGLTLAYGVFREDVGSISYQYTTLPVYVGAKYWIGRQKFGAYVGGAIGVHFAQQRATGPTMTQTQGDSGFAFAIPLGINWRMTYDVGLNLSYTFNYVKDSFFKDDLVNLVAVGLVFPY